MNNDKVTKSEVREAIKDVREALRYAERALDAGDWEDAAECLADWAAPSAGLIGERIMSAQFTQR